MSAKGTLQPEDLRRDPNPLAPYYLRSRVGERLLLDGHSHQAWPDCARDGQLAAFDDAARLGGEKWGRAFEEADRVRRGFARLLEDPLGHYALGANTHELVVRFLSALPLDRRPRLITTSGEFHSIRRQLQRLEEAGLEVSWLPAEPVDDLSERLASAVDGRTAAVLASAVLFQDARIVPGLAEVLLACRRHGAELLVDAYHALNVVPFPLASQGLDEAFVVGGGYKYCQLGEGNCFLRIPPERRMRPVITGWYSEFSALAEASELARVAYGPGADAFAGATYDPTSHYRATRVFAFFEEKGLTPGLLRQVSRHQIRLLAEAFDQLDLDPRIIRRQHDVPLERIGGFLALTTPRAAELCTALAAAGVSSDSRGQSLRLGPAPYLSDGQLLQAVAILGRIAAGPWPC